MDELDHSGFIFDMHQMEFETLESKIAKGITKIIPADFKRKINFLEDTQYKNKRPMLAGRQIMFQIFSFVNINKTQGHPMNLSDLLDNFKMFNQAWQETLPAFGNDLNKHVVENLYERQVNKSTLMKNAMTLYQQDIVLKKSPEATKRTMVKHPRAAAAPEHVDLKKEDQETEQQQSLESLKKKAKIVVLDVKKLVLQRRKMFIRT